MMAYKSVLHWPLDDGHVALRIFPEEGLVVSLTFHKSDLYALIELFE
jgi:hypothetical protein